MDSQDVSISTGISEDEPVTEAPSARAQALRDEIFGTALTLDEAAYVLGLDRTTVAKYLRENSIVGFQIGREWRIPEDELRWYVRRTIEQRRAEASQGTMGTGQQDNLRRRVGWDLIFGQRKRSKNDLFERFTEPARLVVSRAQEEAQRLNHDYLGTEHLLLGLVAVDDPPLVRLLAALGIEPQEIRAALDARIAQIGRGTHQNGEIGLTRRAKKVFELAVEESLRLHLDVTGTEHLLLGMVREGGGVAATVLKAAGVDLEEARAAVSRANVG